MKIAFKKYSSAFLTAILPCLCCPLAGLGAVANVSVGNDFFSPTTTNINVGDQVIWTWESGSEDHNVVSTSSSPAWLFPSPGGGPGTASNQNDSNLRNSPFAFTNTFTSAGTFPYECTEHVDFGMTGTITVAAAKPTPTTSITNPVNGATFTAPASVSIDANASVSSGTVTNVAFFVGATKLGSVQSSPFDFTATGLAAGSYALTVVATASGVSATSSVVNITVNPPAPTVTITNPASGAVFSAPADLKLGATTAVNNGTITNVAFFAGTTLLGSVQTSPFDVTGSSLAAGNYSLTAVATAAGVSATSAVVNVSVVSPVAISNFAPMAANNQFIFSYAANPGLSYVVQNSSNLINWVSLSTNVASNTSVSVTNALAPANGQFYRVGRLPNP